MKDFLIFIPATIVYLAVKSTIFASFPVPDLPLIMVFYLGYTRPSLEGALLCFVVGYIEDALAGGVTGSTSFALIFIFLCAYFLSRKVQFTSSVNCIAINGIISRSSTVMTIQTSRLLFFI